MKLWDVTKNDSSEYLEFVNQSEYSSISSLSWSKDDKFLVWVTSLGELCLLDPNSKEILSLDRDSGSGLSYVTFSQLYNNIFFVGHTSGDFSLNIFAPEGKLQKKKFSLHTNKVSELISSKLNENLLISLSIDQTVCLFDLNEGKNIQQIDVGFPILCGDLNEADYTLVLGGVGGIMQKFDLRKFDRPLLSYQGHKKKDVKALNYNKRYIKKKIGKFVPRNEENDKVKRFSSIHQVNKLSDKMSKLESKINKSKTKVK